MHSGRLGTGSGQAHNNHPQQVHGQISRSSSSSSSSASPVSTAASNQSAMLSAGQPTVPSGIFRTGADNTPPSLRFAGPGSYLPAQYSTIYGIHSQPPGHAAAIQPYSFFPSFGGSTAAGHNFCHGASMPGTSQSHYPQIESYSAILASMGSRVQHQGAPGTDRTSRMQAPAVPGSQQMSPFLPPSSLLVAPAGSYGSMQSSTRSHCSDTRSPSPGPSSSIHNAGSGNTHQDSLSSHHLEKLVSRKGSLSLHGRDRDVPRELRLYGNPASLHGNPASLHEDKLTLSPVSYSGSGHVPKVSFDSVVKEYGGGGDCPPGRADVYTRTSLSGKEGSMKHRILVRPSDSDVPEELSVSTGIHNLKDEPSPKRPKMSSTGSISYSMKSSLENPNDDQELDVHHLPKPHLSSQRCVSKNNAMCRRPETSNHLETHMPEYHVQQPVPYQQADSEEGTDNRNKQHDTSPTRSPASTSQPTGDSSSNLQYPSHFLKGSIIQLANGTLKRVEDLKTEDFVNSAEISADLKVDSSTVVKIEEHPASGTAMLSFCVGEHRVPVTVEATLEHPFFVFGQGWSSCSVSRTLARYGLDCQKLNVGDVCISLTHKDVNLKAAEISQQQQQHQHQEQSYMADQHYKFSVTSNTDSSKHKSPSPVNTSPSPLPTVPGSPTSILSSHQHDHANNLQSPASAQGPKRQSAQADLPPPASNVVLVKRENNNSHKRDFNRAVGELILKESPDEDNSDSIVSLRKRRQSGSDHNAAKVDFGGEEDKSLGTGAAVKTEEEIVHPDAGNNGHHG